MFSVRSPRAITALSRILILTSWSEQSTRRRCREVGVGAPARQAVLHPPQLVIPRLPPSPTTRQRSSVASTRRPSFDLSPTSVWFSRLALT